MSAAKTAIIKDIVDQHFDEVSFLWSRRDLAVTATNRSLQDLVYMDERVEAHIDGLRVGGDYAWELCEAGMDSDEPGTIFAASVIAFESGDKEQVDRVVIASGESHAVFRSVVSALGWMRNRHFKATITGLVSAKSRLYRRLGIAACGVRRVNPRAYLDQAIESSDLYLKARALRSAGELKRVDLLPQLRDCLQHEDNACRFAAAKSALLLGDQSALDTLSAFVLTQSEYTMPAMQVALRLVDAQTARNWLKAQSKNPEQRRQMLTGTGITGEPAYVPMLIKQMRNPEMARVAGEAFSMITGVDLSRENLEGEWPEGFKAGPTDDPEDTDVELDPDENLGWPDAERVLQWWGRHSETFSAGGRYLAGSPVSPMHCAHVLKNGYQRQRQAAALELALSQPDASYFNTRGPGPWQIKRL